MKDCMTGKAKAGKIDKGKAAEASRVFDENMAALGDEGAAAKATLDQLAFDAAERKRRTVLQIQAQRRLHDGIKSAPKMADAAIAAIDATGVHGLPFVSAEAARKANLGLAHAKVTDLIAHHKRNLIGQTGDRAGIVDLVREAFGEASGNANAKAFNAAWQEAAEALRTKFNALGGHIGKHERWGLPTLWDGVKMRVAGADAFVADVLPRLDWEKMEARTGKKFPAASREAVLREVYDTIRTEGWSKREPGGPGGKSVANRRADHRFLEFRTADDWLTMMERYGNADAFSVMMAHMDGMARDIGAMETLGPNPTATIRFLQDTLRQEAKTSTALSAVQANRLESVAEHLPTLYDTYTGAVNRPINNIVGRGFAAVRGALTAAKLGGAFLSALSDPWFGNMTARFVGVPQAKVLGQHLKLFSAVSREDQKLAVRAGLIAENWSQVASAQLRYVGEIPTAQWAQTLSDAVLRGTGLSHWTQAGRWAFGLEFMGALADNAGKAFDALPDPLRRTLANYSISAKEWEAIRATPLYDHNGATFLVPGDVAGDALQTKLLAMIQSETEYAVPSASIRGRAAIGGGVRPGGVAGELLRSAMMFKSFSVTMFFTHIRRAMSLPSNASKASYMAQLVVGTTLMGGLVIGLKDISRGRDPSSPTSASFWGRAMTQGGGLGIFGDFLLSDVNRQGQGLAPTVAGPVVGLGGDVIGLIQKAVKGDDGLGAATTRFIGNYTPGGSAWYARLVFERYVLDQLQTLIDPAHKKRWRTQEQNMIRENDQRFWWPRGQLAPNRAPSL